MCCTVESLFEKKHNQVTAYLKEKQTPPDTDMRENWYLPTADKTNPLERTESHEGQRDMRRDSGLWPH